MMSNEEEKRCPLCAEEMDWTDQQLKPCKCGYQVCVWCWNHIIDMAEKNETEGQCPACRKIYEKEKIVAMQASCERMGNKTVSRKNKPPKAKPKINEAKKDLTNVRVIQRKMAYVIGLPLSLADEDLLLQKEYFGQYGKITKVSLSRNASGAIQQFINDTCSVYITYSKEEEALRCIQSVHGFVLEGRDLRASFGTAKYCHAWLKNTPCNNPSCLYLHSIGDEKDSFGKDEVAAVHTRSRVQQIVGAANNQLRRSGSVLPSPVDCNSSSADTDDTSTGRSAMIDAAHGSVNSNSDVTFTVPFNHKEGVPAPNKMTSFVDIVGQSNFSCPVKDEIIPEDGNLCSKLSSVTINGDLYAGVPYSVAKTSKVSSNHLGIGLCLEEQLKDIPDEPFTEGSLSYDNQGSKGSCSTQRDCFHQQPYPASILEDSCLPTLFHKKFHILSDLNADHNAVNNYEDEASLPFRCVNSVLNDGCHEMKLPSFAKSDRIYRNSSSFSNEEIVEHLRRIDDDNLTNNEESSALDAVESSIISNIMSMDFDSCDDSLRLTNASSELLAETDGLRGSSWNSLNGIQSGFSYPEQANQVAGAVLPDFRDKKERYLCMPQYRATRPQSLAPPGFSVPSRDPPPGFSSCERIGSLPRASSGSCLVSASNTWLQMPSTGFSSATRDVDFTDPALFSSSKGKPANRLNNSGLEMGLARTQQLSAYKDDPFWLLMQQSASANQPSNISQMFTPQTPYPRQEMSYAACTENGLSTLDDIYGLSSRMVDHQHQSHNPSSFSRLSQQKYANGQTLNTNGYLQSLDEVRRRNEVDVIELQRNERIGVNDYFTGYEDLSFSPGDVYSRVFGM